MTVGMPGIATGGRSTTGELPSVIGAAVAELEPAAVVQTAGATRVVDAPDAGGPLVEEGLIERLRAGDEAAFVVLVERHHGTLRRLARMYTSDAVADEVVQETWIAVIRGLGKFEGRSSLRTWIVRILMNIARERGEREQRQIPFSAFVDLSAGSGEAVDPDRFRPAGDKFPGGWVSFPERWDEQPEQRFLSSEGVEVARQAIETLPPAQREVLSLRDIEGWSSGEVAEALGISVGNVRVLLHRGRSRVRAALEVAIASATLAGGPSL